MSMDARRWNSVRTKPGHSAITRTGDPVASIDMEMPSENTVTHDFSAL